MQGSTVTNNALSLSQAIETLIKDYFNVIGHDKITNLHAMVLETVEPPLLKVVIEHCRYNQSKAAQMLGLSRGTLRTKLKQYFDDQYCGTRE